MAGHTMSTTGPGPLSGTSLLLVRTFRLFFNHYAALEATWVAGKLSFEFEILSFELLDSSFDIFNLSFDILDSIFLIHPVNWSQFPLFYEPKCLQFVKT